jgi:NADPH:quinone reductase-like Zn-dependent oxidoreductase
MTGPPDVLALEPIRKPEPAAGEVLVRVRARGKIAVHVD